MNFRLLRLWCALCGLVAVLLFASTLAEIPFRSALRGYDNTFNYLWLRSAMVDGDWDFANDLAACDTLVPEQRASALALPRTAAGRIPNKYGVGWALVSAPFYALADLVMIAGRGLGVTSLARDGFNPVYQACIQGGHFALALFSLALAANVVRRWTGAERGAGLAGVVFVWAASPLLYYQTANLSMSHGVAFFAIAGFAYALLRARSDGGAWWLLAGGAWGLAVITRFPLGVFGVAALWAFLEVARDQCPDSDLATQPGTPGARSASARISRAMRAAGAFGLGAAPLLGLQLWAWHSVYGEWLVFSYGVEGEQFHWSEPELVWSLFSARHGLFYWHPFLLAGAGGLLALLGTRRAAAAGWGLAVAAMVYVNAAWWCWWFASSFGNRGYDAALLPLMAGTAWLLQRAAPGARVVLCGLAVAAGGWNFYLVTLYRSGAISRHEPVTWTEMVRAAARLPAALRF
ncbi:MAG TPA: glycosyltransferase family 39 protein [Opitutus sp.]|nr:glycosyltransferase family 39 protein [Opitutus sp.]